MLKSQDLDDSTALYPLNGRRSALDLVEAARVLSRLPSAGRESLNAADHGEKEYSRVQPMQAVDTIGHASVAR